MTATPPTSLAMSFLQLLAVEIGGRLFDLGFNLLDSGLDGFRFMPLPSTIVVLSLSEVTRRALPRSSTVTESSLRPTSSEMTLPPVRMAISSSIALRLIAESGGFDGQDIDRAAQLVDYQCGQGFAIDILGDDEQVLGNLEDFLKGGQDIDDGRNFLIGNENVGVFDDGFHLLGIGDEIGADIAAVELHTFDEFGLEFEALGFFDGDNAVLADLFHNLGNEVADFVVFGGNGGDLGDLLLAFYLGGHGS